MICWVKIVMGQNFICKYLIIFFVKFFRKFCHGSICHFGPAKPNMMTLKLGETALLGCNW